MPFLMSESGAVTVDWVVLTAAVAGVALATLGVLAGGLAQANRAVETQMSETNAVGDTWAAAMRNYQPHNGVFYGTVYDAWSTLSDDDLDQMNRLVNDVVAEMAPLAETADDNGQLNDLSFAIGRVYSDRVRKRPEAIGADPVEVERIFALMGWNDETMSATY